MNELFTFLFDENVIQTQFKNQWIKIYDPTYVETKIEELLKTKETLQDLSEFLLSKAKVGTFEKKEKEEEEKDKNNLTSDNFYNKTISDFPSLTQNNFNKKKTKEKKSLQPKKKA